MKKLFALLLFGTALLLSGASIEIVKDHKSPYVIIINPANPGPAKRAAVDLQTYIFKATGAKLPIVKEAQRNNRPAFLLGFEKIEKREAFTVKTVGRDIHISGDDTPGSVEDCHWATGARVGSWYGVCDFLEKQLDIRWFMPGELGEYVPKRADWSIPELNYSDAPRMEVRRTWLTYEYKKDPVGKKQAEENNLFLRRNRNGQSVLSCSWHSWLRHLPKEKYFAEHPEYFALVGGRRYGIDALNHGLQLCTTNPQALDEFAKNLIEFRKQFKTDIQLALTPNDGGNFCECPECTKLDDGVRSDGSRIMTTRIMTYANEVARRVNKVLPDQSFGILAYSFYYEGVSKVKLDPHIVLASSNNGVGLSYFNREYRENIRKNLKAWRKVLNKLYFASWPEGMGNLDMPNCQFHNLRRLFDDLYECGVCGAYSNSTTSVAANGLNTYFFLRFAWAPLADYEAFYEDTLRKCYGDKAAPVMRAFFDETEKRLSKLANRKLSADIALGYIKNIPDSLTDGFNGMAEVWLPKLKVACAATKDKGQKARIQMAIDNLEYTFDTIELYRYAVRVAKTQNVQDAVMADKFASSREKRIAAMVKLPHNARPASLKSTEKTYLLPFNRNIFSYLLASKSRKTLNIAYVQNTPVIDGNLNKEFWQKIPANRMELNNSNAQKMAVGAEFKAAYDKNFLYLAFRCEEPKMEAIRDALTKPQSNIWTENYIDLFFAPARQKGYYQLMINSLGTPGALRYFPKSEMWQSQAEIKSSKDKNSWSIELKIPASAFGVKRFQRGEIWSMNFCRSRRTVIPNEGCCWSPTFGSYHVPERFGKAIFR